MTGQFLKENIQIATRYIKGTQIHWSKGKCKLEPSCVTVMPHPLVLAKIKRPDNTKCWWNVEQPSGWRVTCCNCFVECFTVPTKAHPMHTLWHSSLIQRNIPNGNAYIGSPKNLLTPGRRLGTSVCCVKVHWWQLNRKMTSSFLFLTLYCFFSFSPVCALGLPGILLPHWGLLRLKEFADT